MAHDVPSPEPSSVVSGVPVSRPETKTKTTVGTGGPVKLMAVALIGAPPVPSNGDDRAVQVTASGLVATTLEPLPALAPPSTHRLRSGDQATAWPIPV